MPLTLTTLEDKHLGQAAALLAASQAQRRHIEPLLPAAFAAPDEALKPLEETFRSPGASGVIALRDGDVAAFMLAAQRVPGRVMTVPIHGYAAAEGEPLETLREMYALLADDFVRRGHFQHSVTVLHAESDIRDCWDSLGFARWLTAASRPVEEPVPDPPELDIRRLGADHIDVITQLEAANARHHNRSPVFVPYLQEDRDGYRTRTLELLEDSLNAHFVAYEGGEPAGMNTFMKESWNSPLIRSEGEVYLFQGIVYEQYRHAGIGRGLLAHTMRWARSQGFATCSLHYFSGNILGARFWTAMGFRPYAHILTRHIDERIAWARPL